jgi:hypothetical protein
VRAYEYITKNTPRLTSKPGRETMDGLGRSTPIAPAQDNDNDRDGAHKHDSGDDVLHRGKDDLFHGQLLLYPYQRALGRPQGALTTIIPG